MITKDQYIALITSEHIDKQRFVDTVGIAVDPFVGLQNVLFGLPQDFDIDTAIGVQLDAVGIWIGRSRRIDTPLVGVYFAWDGAAADGWNSGIWKGPFDPDSGLVDLPDDSYRVLLKAKIAANSWDGTIPGAYAIWSNVFVDSQLVIQDNQDMSMIVGIAGMPLSIVDQALLTNGYIPLKPEGVRIQYYAIAPEEGTLFAWDVGSSSALDGWDAGQWSQELIPA